MSPLRCLLLACALLTSSLFAADAKDQADKPAEHGEKTEKAETKTKPPVKKLEKKKDSEKAKEKIEKHKLIKGAKSAGPDSKTGKPEPDKALELLKKGNKRFVDGESIHPRLDAARLKQAGTEDPADHAIATIVTGSDSRIPVERIFDQGIMDLHVIRVTGNVMDVDTIGSVEYGIAHIDTPVVLVLGNSQCSAVETVTHVLTGQSGPLERNIPRLLDNIIPAVEHVLAKHSHIHSSEVVPMAIEQNVWQSVRDLFTESPTARDMVRSKKVMVVGGIYEVDTGKVNYLPVESVWDILEEVEADPDRAMDALADPEKFGMETDEDEPTSFALIVHEDNPLTHLSTAQVRLIMSGDTTNWISINGTDGPIKLYIPGERSRMKGRFAKYALNEREYRVDAEPVKDVNERLALVSGSKAAMAIVPFPFVRTDGIKILAINGLPPTAPNYPYTMRRR